ncbi:hypothetical protein KXV19_004567 [Aspergillus fumigatus]|nr:hypothetical protein KXV19_004567 [Aspergillus fumigatus]
MGAVSGAPLAIRQNTGKTEEWFPGQDGLPKTAAVDAVFGRPSATPSATSSCTYVHAPPSTDRRPTQTSFVRSAVYLLANTDFPYTSLRSLKCAKNGALSTVPL